MSTLKVGIAGAGGIAQAHSIAWRANEPRGKVVAYADISPTRAQALSDNFTGGTAKIYDTLDAMIADPNVEVIDICLPHDLHADAIVKAAQAGKIILCEKPLCTTMEDSLRISNVLKETSAKFMMAHNQLFQPSLVEARQLLSLGTIGKPFIFRSIECFQNKGALLGTSGRQKPKDGGEGAWEWRADVKRMGGGEVLDTGWHSTYRLLSLANSRPVEVSAVMDRFLIPGLPQEDTGALTVTFESGAIGQILTTWAFSAMWDLQFEVFGELGNLAGTPTQVLHNLHGWTSPAVKDVPATHTFTAEVSHFLDVIQNGAESMAPFEIGARVLQLTKAAYKSVAEKRTIALPEDAAIEA